VIIFQTYLQDGSRRKHHGTAFSMWRRAIICVLYQGEGFRQREHSEDCSEHKRAGQRHLVSSSITILNNCMARAFTFPFKSRTDLEPVSLLFFPFVSGKYVASSLPWPFTGILFRWDGCYSSLAGRAIIHVVTLPKSSSGEEGLKIGIFASFAMICSLCFSMNFCNSIIMLVSSPFSY
jgi:hypothetical protein